MPEDKWDVGGSLSELSASEYLLFNSDAFKADLQGTASSSENAASAQFSLVPQDKDLPVSSVEIKGREAGSPSVDLSVATKLWRYGNRTVYMPESAGGRQVTDTLSGKFGPVGAFYSEGTQPGNRDLQQTSYGGSLDAGPVQLYGQRNQSSQDVVDPRDARFFQNTRQNTETDTFGARGSLPFLGGSLSGDISRQLRTNTGPQHISQDARPTGQSPNVTNYKAGWRGKAGPGNLDLGVEFEDVRGVGMQPSVGGSYAIPNPLGLGGEFTATGSFVNPLDPNRESAAEAMLRYKLRF